MMIGQSVTRPIISWACVEKFKPTMLQAANSIGHAIGWQEHVLKRRFVLDNKHAFLCD